MHIHILGICGTFMGGVAQLACEAGHKVTGCDAHVYPPMSDALRNAGIEIMEGYDVSQLDAVRPDVFVIGNAISRGNPLLEAILNRGLSYTSGPAWLCEHVLAGRHVLAVAGTHGKTTTTSLTDYLLKASGEASVAVGNIGEPPINEIDGRAHNEWFVAELSSYQIATTTELHPRVAVLLNITPDHLGWHKSHKNYALAKIKLFDNMVDDDLVVVDVEDAGIHEFDEYIYTPGRRICKVAFDEPEGADAAFVRDGKMVVRLKGVETQLVATSELKISGHHNVINALCAATAALAVGADVDGVRRGLASFQPLEHRVEPCGEIDGVRYVNDSKATNTDAVEKALTAFPDDDVILLLGGHDKGTPLTDFARVVMDNVRSVVCFGDARERFTAAMDEADVDGDVDIAQADDLRDAVDVARSLSSRGDVILLSPACSSFDEFSGYEERGRVFKDYVAQLAAAAKSQME